MTDSINTVEAYLKQAAVRLEQVRLKLDLLLEKKAKEKAIAPHQQCSLDNISLIPEQLEELRGRYRKLQATRDQALLELGEKVARLEGKVDRLQPVRL